MEKSLGRGSIKYKFTRNMLIVLGITYLVIVMILLAYVRTYFYTTFFNQMKNNILLSQKHYENNIGTTQTLVETLYNDDDTWWKSQNARVQIYDVNKNILLDSQANLSMESQRMDEVEYNKDVITDYQVFNIPSTNEHVMSVSVPLKSSDNEVGILRHISSLKEVDNNLKKIAILFFLIGGMVTTIASLISILMVDNIIKPIGELTKSALMMAEGNYKVRSKVKKNDEIGALARTFNYMADEINKKEALKNEFISSVSHELRTPLTAIKGWAVTLKEPEIIMQANDDLINDKKSVLETGLETIDTEAERLKKLVEELLDFSKFASGKIELKPININVDELLSYIKNFVSGRLERESKTFIIEKEENVTDFIADKNRIKQVLINLIDNAIKFTQNGDTITLHVSQDKENTYLDVIDTGVGIEEADLDKVKERFFKGKHSKAANGIGLSITNEIAILHGGRLDVKSKIGEGTSMLVVIPREVKIEKNN